MGKGNWIRKDYTNSPTINYYKELINSEPKEDILVAKLITPRKEEFAISSKDLYDNPYDTFDLNKDFDIAFYKFEYLDYKYMDINITLKVEGKYKKNLYIFNGSNEKDKLTKIENYRVSINNNLKYYQVITVNYVNVDLWCFKLIDGNRKLEIRYSTSSLFKSSWKNSDLDITIIYRK